MDARTRIGVVLGVVGCRPDLGSSDSDDVTSAATDGDEPEQSSTSTSSGPASTSGDASTGGCELQPPPGIPNPTWCEVTPSNVTFLEREIEVVFDARRSEWVSAVHWNGTRVLFAFVLGEPRQPMYEIRGSTNGDAAFDIVWPTAPLRPGALWSTPIGTLVVADASSEAHQIARLLPSGEIEVITESEVAIVPQPPAIDDEWMYVLLATDFPVRSVGRVPIGGGDLEILDFTAETIAMHDEGLVALTSVREEYCSCSLINCRLLCEGCSDEVVSHDLVALDPVNGSSTVIAEELCASRLPETGPFAARLLALGSVADGIVAADEAIVHIGWDGTRRVIAAPPHRVDGGQVFDGWVYFVSEIPGGQEEVAEIARAPIEGGDVETLARIPHHIVRPSTLETVTPTHVYVRERDINDASWSVVRRLAL